MENTKWNNDEIKCKIKEDDDINGVHSRDRMYTSDVFRNVFIHKIIELGIVCFFFCHFIATVSLQHLIFVIVLMRMNFFVG